MLSTSHLEIVDIESGGHQRQSPPSFVALLRLDPNDILFRTQSSDASLCEIVGTVVGATSSDVL